MVVEFQHGDNNFFRLFFLMKRKFFFVLFVVIGLMRLASQTEIPEVVLRKADSLLRGRSAVWHIQHGVFSVEYFEEGVTKSRGWNGIGEEIFAEQAVASEELPPIVLSYIIKNYPQVKIGRVFLRMERKSGPLFFHVEVGEVDLFFDGEGNFLYAKMKMGKKIRSM